MFALREFRAMWLAEVFSVAGDQVARVALAVLVFDRTNSAALTGLTYALTFVPALLGGVLLSGLGDRYPRREVMIATDLARAALVGLMTVPGAPLWLLCILVAAMTLLAGPFKAAQQAALPDVLPGSKYMVGMAIRNISGQAAQVVGFAGGGLLVAEFGARTGLA
ncbi:MAG: MFS transporter [Thermocrispum sp.]